MIEDFGCSTMKWNPIALVLNGTWGGRSLDSCHVMRKQAENRFSYYRFLKSTLYATVHRSTYIVYQSGMNDDRLNPNGSTYRFCCCRVVLRTDSCCANTPWRVDMLRPCLKGCTFSLLSSHSSPSRDMASLWRGNKSKSHTNIELLHH